MKQNPYQEIQLMSLFGFYAPSTFLYQKCYFRRCLLSARRFHEYWHETKFCQARFLLLFIDRIKSKKKTIFFPSYNCRLYDSTAERCGLESSQAFCQSQRRGHLSFSPSYERITLVLQYDRKMCPDLDGCCRCTRLLI